MWRDILCAACSRVRRGPRQQDLLAAVPVQEQRYARRQRRDGWACVTPSCCAAADRCCSRCPRLLLLARRGAGAWHPAAAHAAGRARRATDAASPAARGLPASPTHVWRAAASRGLPSAAHGRARRLPAPAARRRVRLPPAPAHDVEGRLPPGWGYCCALPAPLQSVAKGASRSWEDPFSLASRSVLALFPSTRGPCLRQRCGKEQLQRRPSKEFCARGPHGLKIARLARPHRTRRAPQDAGHQWSSQWHPPHVYARVPQARVHPADDLPAQLQGRRLRGHQGQRRRPQGAACCWLRQRRPSGGQLAAVGASPQRMYCDSPQAGPHRSAGEPPGPRERCGWSQQHRHAARRGQPAAGALAATSGERARRTRSTEQRRAACSSSWGDVVITAGRLCTRCWGWACGAGVADSGLSLCFRLCAGHAAQVVPGQDRHHLERDEARSGCGDQQAGAQARQGPRVQAEQRTTQQHKSADGRKQHEGCSMRHLVWAH